MIMALEETQLKAPPANASTAAATANSSKVTFDTATVLKSILKKAGKS